MSNIEYEVEKILNKRVKKRKIEYLVKWKNWSSDYNSWEPTTNLNCDELIEDYKSNEKMMNSSKATNKELQYDANKSNNKPKGFERGLNPELIIGATNAPGETYFLIKVCLTYTFSY